MPRMDRFWTPETTDIPMSPACLWAGRYVLREVPPPGV